MATARTHPDNDPISGEGSSGIPHEFFECSSGSCKVRFPAPSGYSSSCPLCKSPVLPVCYADSNYLTSPETSSNLSEISILLDNIRSAYNVGSILRTADGAGIKHAYLCGITPTPLQHRLAKTALTAELNIAWSNHLNGILLAKKLKQSGHSLIAIETSRQAQNLFTLDKPLEGSNVLIVGNEICGIDPDLLSLCDREFYLPMFGKKNSLNVAVTLGIAVYSLTFGLNRKPPVQS
jgi:tRNA G18 (ribose-2'-O)-methylase SpoU